MENKGQDIERIRVKIREAKKLLMDKNLEELETKVDLTKKKIEIVRKSGLTMAILGIIGHMLGLTCSNQAIIMMGLLVLLSSSVAGICKYRLECRLEKLEKALLNQKNEINDFELDNLFFEYDNCNTR